MALSPKVAFPRIVIDTNILISQHLSPRSIPARAFERAVRSSVILLSEATFFEMTETLLKEKFDRYSSAATRKKLLADFEATSTRIQVSTVIDACRHTKDNKFLELAVDGRVDLILSGDNDLLVLSPFRGIPVVTPMQYLVED
jgi:putative PIN family toxin of toxin-antitoxin system